MSVVQALFLLGMTVVLLAVVAFGVAVYASAVRDDGSLGVPTGIAGRFRSTREERAELHRLAFYAHRITGFAILAFLCLHILDLSTYALSRATYDELHALYGTAPMRVFECGLLFAILFHTFNGLRLLAIDLADLGIDASRRALLAVVALTVALGAAGSGVIVAPLFA